MWLYMTQSLCEISLFGVPTAQFCLPKIKRKSGALHSMSFRDTLRSQLSCLKQMETQTDRLTTLHSHTANKYSDKEELSSRLSKMHEHQVTKGEASA